MRSCEIATWHAAPPGFEYGVSELATLNVSVAAASGAAGDSLAATPKGV